MAASAACQVVEAVIMGYGGVSDIICGGLMAFATGVVSELEMEGGILCQGGLYLVVTTGAIRKVVVGDGLIFIFGFHAVALGAGDIGKAVVK